MEKNRTKICMKRKYYIVVDNLKQILNEHQTSKSACKGNKYKVKRKQMADEKNRGWIEKKTLKPTLKGNEWRMKRKHQILQ